MTTYSFTLINNGQDNTVIIPSDADLTGATLVHIEVASSGNFDNGYEFSYGADSVAAHGAVIRIPAVSIAQLRGAYYRLAYTLNGTVQYGTTGELFGPDVSNGYAHESDVDALRSQIASLSGNTDEGDAVTRAHLWDVPPVTDLPDNMKTPGMYYDSVNNIAGIGNVVLEVFTIPGVVLQRATGIDSGKVATRRNYADSWSSWLVVSPA